MEERHCIPIQVILIEWIDVRMLGFISAFHLVFGVLICFGLGLLRLPLLVAKSLLGIVEWAQLDLFRPRQILLKRPTGVL